MIIRGYADLHKKGVRLENTHLDKPTLVGYTPRPHVAMVPGSIVTAKSNMCIFLPDLINQQLSGTKGKGEICGKFLYKLIEKIPANVLFLHQYKLKINEIDCDFLSGCDKEEREYFIEFLEAARLRIKTAKRGGSKSGNFRGGRDSEPYIILRGKTNEVDDNVEILKNSILNSIDQNKKYKNDSDLLDMAESLYLAAQNISPILAKGLTEIRNVSIKRHKKNKIKNSLDSFNENHRNDLINKKIKITNDSEIISYEISDVDNLKKRSIVMANSNLNGKTGGTDMAFLVIMKHQKIKNAQDLANLMNNNRHHFPTIMQAWTKKACEKYILSLIKKKIISKSRGAYRVFSSTKESILQSSRGVKIKECYEKFHEIYKLPNNWCPFWDVITKDGEKQVVSHGRPVKNGRKQVAKPVSPVVHSIPKTEANQEFVEVDDLKVSEAIKLGKQRGRAEADKVADAAALEIKVRKQRGRAEADKVVDAAALEIKAAYDVGYTERMEERMQEIIASK